MAATKKPRKCAVCERKRPLPPGADVPICGRCANPTRVRSVCVGCGTRLDLSLEAARTLFSKAGMNIWRTGVALRFPNCPHCAKFDDLEGPTIFMIQHPDVQYQPGLAEA